MTDPIAFTSTLPRFGLPLLFQGQAQKEFYVNQAHALIDLLLHPAITGEATDPPAAPEDGECWLVGASAVAEWQGRDGSLAGFKAGTWLFIAPHDGMRVYDRSRGRTLFYRNGWQGAEAIAAPSGGEVVDTQARAALLAMLESLASVGLLPA